MKQFRKIYLIAIFIGLISIASISNLNIMKVKGAVAEIEPDFGPAPKLDGYINKSAKEWNNATKISIKLGDESGDDFPIDLWIMQNNSDLYISVQFEFGGQEENDFVGILISESESEDPNSFVDGKVLQWSDLGGENEKVEYTDYYIEDGVFYRDDNQNGDGDAQLDEEAITYEFRIPVNNTDDEDDVFLDSGEYYAFNITYGHHSGSYSNSILKSNVVLIEIQYPPGPGEPDIWEIVLFVLSVITFSALGALFGFYIYKIYILKKKMERIK